MKYGPWRKIVVAAAVTGAVLSVVWAGHETRRAAELHAVMPARPEARQARTFEGQPTAPVAGVPTEPPAGSAIHPPDSAVDQAVAVWATGDPTLQNLYLAAERSSLPERYAALWENLGLSAAQAEKLADLILQREEQRLDIAAIARAQGFGTQDSAVARLQARADQAFRASVAALLGEAAYQEIVAYERALPVWQFVNQFAGAVALEGQPLSQTQAIQLTATLANASPPYRAGGEADTNVIEWPAVLAESPSILTPPQQVSFFNALPRYPVEIQRLPSSALPFPP